MRERSVLVLNADYSVLNITTLNKVLGLFVKDKINVLKCSDCIRIHPQLNIEGTPAVVALKNYVYVPFRRINLTRRKVFQRDNYTCQYCRTRLNNHTATIDHVVPKSHKDSPGNTWNNMVASCNKCNNVKGNKTPQEAKMNLIRNPFTPGVEHFFPIKEDWKDFIKLGKSSVFLR